MGRSIALVTGHYNYLFKPKITDKILSVFSSYKNFMDPQLEKSKKVLADVATKMFKYKGVNLFTLLTFVMSAVEIIASQAYIDGEDKLSLAKNLIVIAIDILVEKKILQEEQSKELKTTVAISAVLIDQFIEVGIYISNNPNIINDKWKKRGSCF